jgi:hypothetical protein
VVEASASTRSISRTWSIVIPNRSDPLPAELLPIIPPIVARLDVEVSGPNISPCDAAARLRSSWTTPGCTRAVRASGSSSLMSYMCREKSRTMPGVIVWPTRLVPAPRASTGRPASAASRTTATTSPTCRG